VSGIDFLETYGMIGSMSILPKLIVGMKNAGYLMFTLRPDRQKPEVSLISVNQDISRMGTHPSFWDVIDWLELDGAYGTERTHQLRQKLPEGTYLTFI